MCVPILSAAGSDSTLPLVEAPLAEGLEGHIPQKSVSGCEHGLVVEAGVVMNAT
jgi:hypothetical protein